MSFRREKYVPKGGPDGGDGGRGGDVLFVVRDNLKTLNHLKRSFTAGSGEAGRGNRCHGRAGTSVEIAVPPGTRIRDAHTTDRVRHDFGSSTEPYLLLRGGRGGLGNSHFRSARRQTPRFAQPGEPGLHATVRVELSLIADIGLVGAPNVGKSSLLGQLTAASPLVAAYSFSTCIPQLGVLRRFDGDIILTDIPGILPGASQGVGLGLDFLKHIARVRALIMVLSLESEMPYTQLQGLLAELASYNPDLLTRARLIVANKLDLPDAQERLLRLQDALRRSPSGRQERLVAVSALLPKGMEELRQAVVDLYRAAE